MRRQTVENNLRRARQKFEQSISTFDAYLQALYANLDYETSKHQKKINLRIDILEKIKFESLKRDERLDDESYEQLMRHYVALKQIMRSTEKLSRLDASDNFKHESDSDVTHVDVNLNVDISQQDSRNRENNENRDESKKDNRQFSHERTSIFDNKRSSRSVNQINLTSRSKNTDANRAITSNDVKC